MKEKKRRANDRDGDATCKASTEIMQSALQTSQRFGDWRVTGVAVLFGLLAGVLAGLVFRAMGLAQHEIWRLVDQSWQGAIVIMLGGMLVAIMQLLLRRLERDSNGAGRLTQRQTHRWRFGLIALLAVISVGFGGAIGPEAGLVAVVTELTLLVGLRLKRAQVGVSEEMLGQWGRAAALGGLYLSPLAGAAYEREASSPAKHNIVIAALMGFLGFVVICHAVGSGAGLVIELPKVTYMPRLSDVAAIALAACLAGLLAAGYMHLRHIMAQQVKQLCSRPWRLVMITLTLTAVFAILAILQPLVQFSGHHDFGQLLELFHQGDYSLLFGIGILKLLACAVCLTAGWRGGDAFPLMLAGAAVSLATGVLLPGVEGTHLVATGMAAALAVGLGRPIVALLLVMCIIAGQATVAVCLGVVIGSFIAQLLSPPKMAHD